MKTRSQAIAATNNTTTCDECKTTATCAPDLGRWLCWKCWTAVRQQRATRKPNRMYR